MDADGHKDRPCKGLIDFQNRTFNMMYTKYRSDKIQ